MKISSKLCLSQIIRPKELTFWENNHPPDCVTCHVIIFSSIQIGWASWWRVCYQRCLPCLVYSMFYSEKVYVFIKCMKTALLYTYCVFIISSGICSAYQRPHDKVYSDDCSQLMKQWPFYSDCSDISEWLLIITFWYNIRASSMIWYQYTTTFKFP